MRVKSEPRSPNHRIQRGFALMALLAILATGMLYFLVNQLDEGAMQRRQDGTTTQALARAKTALIAYAVSVDLSLSGNNRPGDLPCPDRDNDGKAGTTVPLVTSCGNAAGTTFQDRRLGRLPWVDLGLPDLRDGSGERLWYAVSNNFKNSTRTATLNSDTIGTISIRDGAGNLIYDGSNVTGVVAVIVAPGPPLTRQDGLAQDRSAANANDPKHYLDDIASEDNAAFVDSTSNGFFMGPVRQVGSPRVLIANDRLLVVTRDEILAAVEQRVIAEAANCLESYAAQPQNNGRLPWAASLATSAAGDYSDTSNALFGRLPSSFLGNTAADSTCPPPQAGAMWSNWTGTCMINSGTWFDNNWRDTVFVAIADAYKPVCPLAGPTCVAGTCLTVNKSGTMLANRAFAVILAGRSLPGQVRATAANRSGVGNYLELENSSPADLVFETRQASPTFNDRLRYFPH